MINSQNEIHPNECHCLAWKPIIAGSLVAIGLTFLLNLFSVAIGLNAFTTNSEGVQTLAFGGLLGTAIGIVAAMFASGWLAGYLGQRRCTKRHLGALYGFLTWCVSLLLAVFLASHIHEYVAFYGHFLSGTTDVIVSNATSDKQVVMEGAMHTSGLVISTYIIFALFFLSAFASALGGHCGMRHCCKQSC